MAGTGNPELDREVERLNGRLQQALSLVSAMAELKGEAESRDGFVQVTLSSNGMLSGLTINPRAMKQGSEALAEQILETVKTAQENLSKESQELVAPLLGDMGRYREMLSNGSLQDAAATISAAPSEAARSEDPIRTVSEQFERIQQLMGMNNK
ncbi:YbaB/EbfC family nucleoid-associated protein [Actinomadura terrae]|uniref:YbaB/EbfC family nucleoid-associated protein n=1 Tax=Actinomadura terrae TaxID=604353 RepID=UPI001FA6F08E|nr:YbaB/EbfC family nucleoid-associated protein [Actinomadura terrae]